MSNTKNKEGGNVPSLAEGRAFVHNKSKGTFHVPLLNPHPSALEEPIVFQLDEVKTLDTVQLKEQRFLNCFDGGFLETFSPEQYAAHLKSKQKAKAEDARKQIMGSHPESGLPLNRTMAIQQIGLIDDIDTLKAILEKEDRASIMAALEERIEELEDKEFS